MALFYDASTNCEDEAKSEAQPEAEPQAAEKKLGRTASKASELAAGLGVVLALLLVIDCSATFAHMANAEDQGVMGGIGLVFGLLLGGFLLAVLRAWSSDLKRRQAYMDRH